VICIRIFRTRKEAELGKKILEEGGIEAIVTEDKFNGVPIDRFKVPSRLRLKFGKRISKNPPSSWRRS